MLSKKKSLSKKIGEHIARIKQESSISPAVLLKMNILLIYQRELRAAENSLVTVLKDLNQTLSSDYGSIENIKKTCRMRQEDMRNAAVLVEEDYNIILDLEKELSSIHTNGSSVQSHFKLVNEFLSEISQAADILEKNLMEDVFSEYKNMPGAGLETVVKLSKDSLHEHNMKLLQDGSDKTSEGKAGPEEERGGRARGISMLIDSSSNQYILSRPRDVTFPVEDHHFIHDIINILLLSFVLGGVCSLITIPSLFGCMFAGMVLGPTGWNVVGSVVQVESLGEVGVIFIVFTVGLDFSFQKLQKVREEDCPMASRDSIAVLLLGYVCKSFLSATSLTPPLSSRHPFLSTSPSSPLLPPSGVASGCIWGEPVASPVHPPGHLVGCGLPGPSSTESLRGHLSLILQ